MFIVKKMHLKNNLAGFFVVSFVVTKLAESSILKRQATTVPTFHREQVGTVTSNHIEEASGLAASRKHPGYLYTHNDHGDGPYIYVISASSGHREATFTLSGVTSNDWEDIALGPCKAGNTSEFCIYIGDFGDGGSGAVNNIYRVVEPDNVQSQTINVALSDRMEFTWDQTDCETLMVDPSANLYIISKVDNGAGTVAKIPTSAWGSGSRVDVSSTAILNIDSTKKDPTGGDISHDGNEVLIKAKHAIFYWNTNGGSDYLTILQKAGNKVNYIDEPQGEAVCWDAAGLGYYTLSEGANQPLYHYVRN